MSEALDGITAVLDCQIDGTTAATCDQTYIGPVSLLGDDQDSSTATDVTTTNTALTTLESTTTLEQSLIAFIPITLVDSIESAAETGASGSASTAANTNSMASTSGGSSSTAAQTGGSSTASQTSGSSTASATASPSGNSDSGASKVQGGTLVLSAVGAGLMGLVAFFL